MSQLETVRPSEAPSLHLRRQRSRGRAAALPRGGLRAQLARVRVAAGTRAGAAGDRFSAAGPATRPRSCTRATGAAATIGLDNSPRFLARAWRQSSRGVAFGEHDIARVPFPTPPADLIYGRFVVTHLSDAGAAIARWASAITPRGRLALEEVDAMTSDEPTLIRYYELVEAMQAARGQQTYVGRDLPPWLPPTRSSSSGPTSCRSCCRRLSPPGCTRSTSGPGGKILSSSATSMRESWIASANRWRRWPPARVKPRRCAGEWRR